MNTGDAAPLTDNAISGVVNKLIVEMSQDRAAIRSLTSAVIADRDAQAALADSICGLTREIHDERAERIDADERLNKRIARIAQEVGRTQIQRVLPLAMSGAALLGGAVAWILERGPGVIASWQGLP